MVKQLYAVYDLVGKDIVGPVWLFPSKGPAVRMLQDLANDAQSDISRHADDYCLVELGEFECETAAVTPKFVGLDEVSPSSPCVVIVARDLIRPQAVE